MNNNEWITDRKPMQEDADVCGYVWITDEDGCVCQTQWTRVTNEPWMHFTRPKPYANPKRYMVLKKDWRAWVVHDTVTQCDLATDIYSPIAAERIAAIYEEVRP